MDSPRNSTHFAAINASRALTAVQFRLATVSDPWVLDHVLDHVLDQALNQVLDQVLDQVLNQVLKQVLNQVCRMSVNLALENGVCHLSVATFNLR